MLARIGRLAFTALAFSVVGATAAVFVYMAAVFVYMALVGDPEPPAGPRRVVPPRGAARPWLVPAPPDEYRVDPADEPDPDEPIGSLTRGTLALMLGLSLLLAIAAGVVVGVVLAPGSSLI